MNQHDLEEVFLSSQEVYHGKLINVEHWQVRLSNGQTALREIVKHRGAAAIVPLDEQGNVTLVCQHRVAVGRFTWEIPAGKLDSDSEDMLDAAKRELEEETGLHAENWQLLVDMDTTPGFCDEHIAIYLATGLSQHHMHTDEDEFLNVDRVPLGEAVRRVMAGEIHDSKTIAGRLMVWNRQNRSADMPLAALTSIQRNSTAFTSQAK